MSTPSYSPFTEQQFDTYLLESEEITGPFRYIRTWEKIDEHSIRSLLPEATCESLGPKPIS